MTAIIVSGFIIGQEAETKKADLPPQASKSAPQKAVIEIEHISEGLLTQPIPDNSTINMLDNEVINGKPSVNDSEQTAKVEAIQNNAITMVNEAEAENTIIRIEAITKKETLIKDQIEALDLNLLELDTQLDMDMDMDIVNIEAITIKNKLHHFEQRLNALDENTLEWNQTEQMMLNAKSKLKALEEKLKLEGDWGKVRLKLDPKEQYQKLNLKYQYGF